jgi:hypothetical protein
MHRVFGTNEVQEKFFTIYSVNQSAHFTGEEEDGNLTSMMSVF